MEKNKLIALIAAAIIIIAAIAAAVVLTSGNGNKDVSVSKVTLDKTSITLDVGSSYTLTPTVSPSDATNKNVTWKSSNTSVATVSNGVVIGVSAGNATITVTTVDGSKTATCSVTVKAVSTVVNVTGVSLDNTTLEVVKGSSAVLTAAVVPSNASNKDVTWKSNDESIATVLNGVVTGVSNGTTTITATTADGSKTATCTVTVKTAMNSYAYDFKYTQSVRLAVFGNVNGDDDIDQKDMVALTNILEGKALFDQNKNAYADVNADGVIDSADIAALQKILDKEETTLYYWDVEPKIASIKWPIDKSNLKIATHHIYPIDALIILGEYDKIIGTTNQSFSNSITAEDRYPGVGDKIKNIGEPNKGAPETLAASGANLFIAPWYNDYSKLETLIANGLDMQIIMLPITKCSADYVDQYGSLLILGFILDDMEQAHKYLDWADGIEKKVADGVARLDKTYTFISPFLSISDSETTISLDSPYTNGSAPGDVYTLSKLPMRSVNLVVDSGCPKVSLEWVYTVNPDVIFIIQFQNGSHSVEAVEEDFNNKAEVFKYTDAYANKQIYGVNYYNIANYFGIPQLLLMASYIWPDIFSEEEGWEAMQYCYDNFSMYSNPDVKNMGNAQPYKMA
jgi:ABC-type Fe3+-hydroxamate transport system substrate-binding protein